MKLIKIILMVVFILMEPFSVYSQSISTLKIIQCNDSLWSHVYNPYRLEILQNCMEVTGIVFDAHFESDGDAHILIKLDVGQENLLYPMNYEKLGGYLVVEPICATLINGQNPKIECEGYTNNIYLPNIGEHVKVKGSYVFDTKHSWSEIHPVTSIEPY